MYMYTLIYLNPHQPEPSILQVPNIRPCIECIGTLQNRGFWLVKVEKEKESSSYSWMVAKIMVSFGGP